MSDKIKTLSIAFKKGAKAFKPFLNAVFHMQDSMSLFKLHIEHYNSLERDTLKLAHLTGDLNDAKERMTRIEQEAKDISRTTTTSQFFEVYKGLFENEYKRLAKGEGLR